MEASQYRALVEARMVENGYQVQHSDPTGLLGYRRQFRLRWMATTLHLLVNVAVADVVTGAQLGQFTQATLEHAKAVKGDLRGFQSGVAAITAVIGHEVGESAATFARDTIVKGFAAFAWPVVVDLSAGTRISHVGRPVLGAVYTSWMRQQIDLLLPAPAEVAAVSRESA